MSTKQKLMIFSVGAGSGHLRAAEALAEAARTNPDVEAVINRDALDFTNKLFHDLYGGSYMMMVKSAPALWGWFYDATDEPWKTDRMRKYLSRFNAGPLMDRVEAERPDAVICTHFFPAEVLSELIRKNKLTTRLAIVVTDFHLHAMWLSRVFHHYFVANEESRIQLKMLGFPEDRITVSGIPIHPVFARREDRRSLLQKHGLAADLPTVLVSGGTFGVTSAEDVVRALGLLQEPAQVVVICGRNEELKRDVESVVAKVPVRGPRFYVLGYTDVMHEWMSVANVLISKPGGLTTSEAMAKQLPMVIYQPIPGQEDANSDFLLEQGAAVKCIDITTLAYKVDAILGDVEKIALMRAASAKVARPLAADTIIRSVLHDIDAEPERIPAAATKSALRPNQWAQPIRVDGVPNLFRVSENLYRSGQPTGDGFERLEELGIRTITNLRSFDTDRRLLKNTDLVEHRVPVQNWLIEKEDIVDFLRTAQDSSVGPCLVHCRQGSDRTGVMCAFYRIIVETWSKDQALDEMVNGGFGFHPIWTNLIRFVEQIEIDTIRGLLEP